jgi:hypothetical protein
MYIVALRARSYYILLSCDELYLNLTHSSCSDSARHIISIVYRRGQYRQKFFAKKNWRYWEFSAILALKFGKFNLKNEVIHDAHKLISNRNLKKIR